MSRYRSKSWRAFSPQAPRPASEPARPRVAASQPVAFKDSATPVRILGLDPGSRFTGYGIIEVRAAGIACVAHGRLEIDGLPLAERLARIHAGVSALLVEHSPHEIAIERVFVNRNVESALKLGQARGAAIAALGGDLPLAEYAPRAVKLATVGTGAADKLQVAHMVRALLKPAGKLSADAADALAIALCHAQHRRLAALANLGVS